MTCQRVLAKDFWTRVRGTETVRVRVAGRENGGNKYSRHTRTSSLGVNGELADRGWWKPSGIT